MKRLLLLLAFLAAGCGDNICVLAPEPPPLCPPDAGACPDPFPEPEEED